MSIFANYYTQEVSLHRRTGINEYGDVAYAPPTKIMCRVEHNYKEILDTAGNKITSEAMLFTTVMCKPLDIVIVDGVTYTVKSCKPINNLAGTLDHYEVYV